MGQFRQQHTPAHVQPAHATEDRAVDQQLRLPIQPNPYARPVGDRTSAGRGGSVLGLSNRPAT
jgi:hypothetical protein